MATITIGGNEISTSGTLPAVGTQAPDFKLKKTDLSETSLKDFKGKRVIMNIFPSIDTDVCATSVKNFNTRATQLDNTSIQEMDTVSVRAKGFTAEDFIRETKKDTSFYVWYRRKTRRHFQTSCY